jgi:hypothetical protein
MAAGTARLASELTEKKSDLVTTCEPDAATIFSLRWVWQLEPHLLKFKNPAAPAVKLEVEEDWR